MTTDKSQLTNDKLLLALLTLALSLAARNTCAESIEKELPPAETESALRALAIRFQSAPAVRAKIVSEIEDLVGKRTEEGEMLIERPARVLRKFTKPTEKWWLLENGTLSEFARGQKSISVKDLTGAPNLLKQIQGAMTGDLTALAPSYAFKIFESKDGTQHLVMDRKPATSRRAYKRIEARIAPAAAFFHEIHYIPEEGDEITEKFLDIQTFKKFPDADFALPEANRKVEKISD